MATSLPYAIEVSKQAAKYINRLDRPSRERFLKQIKELAKDPLGNSKPLVNTDPPARSCRVGDWRIVLSILDGNEPPVVLIDMVQPRGQVYSRL